MTNYYKTKHGEFGKTWAILNEKNEVVVCDWRQVRKWRKEGGERRSQIKFNRIGLQEIQTRFHGESSKLDGAHLFWQVLLSTRSILDSGKTKPSRVWQVFEFGTLEAALAFHEEQRKQMSQLIRDQRRIPERAQELLAELSYWCEQEWGRQARVAREVGTTAQTVNDWLAGRKKMTGEQALRVQELLKKERRLKSRSIG